MTQLFVLNRAAEMAPVLAVFSPLIYFSLRIAVDPSRAILVLNRAMEELHRLDPPAVQMIWRPAELPDRPKTRWFLRIGGMMLTASGFFLLAGRLTSLVQ